MSSHIEFNSDLNSKYNLNTYKGRLFHFINLFDLRQSFVNTETILKAKKLLETHKQTQAKLTISESNQLWKAKYLVNGCIHFETGEIIPWPYRINSFIFVNIPIIFGLMCLPTTSLNLFIFNFINQSYNACMNYYNGTKAPKEILLSSYLLAVSSSILSAFYLKSLFGQGSTGRIKNLIVRLLPSGIAGFMNLVFMRNNYMTKGISFTDNHHNKLGEDRIIGSKALVEGGISRFFLPMPMGLALVLSDFIVKNSIITSNWKLKLSELFFSSLFLYSGLPFSIAIFNPTGKISIAYIESKNKELLRKIEYKDKVVYYNKGL